MKIQFLVLGFLVLIISCKKDKNSYLGSSFSIHEPNYVDGQIIISRTLVFDSKSFSSYGSFLHGIFYDTLKPKDAWELSHCVAIGTVSVNGIKLQKNTFFISQGESINYEDSTFTFFTDPFTYAATGSSVFPNIKITDNTKLPEFSGYSKLPDTIICNKSFSFVLEGIKDADYTEVYIYGEINSIHTVLCGRHLKPNENKVVLTKEEMQLIENNNVGSTEIFVALTNRKFIAVKNKVIQITKESQYSKTDIYIKK